MWARAERALPLAVSAQPASPVETLSDALTPTARGSKIFFGASRRRASRERASHAIGVKSESRSPHFRFCGASLRPPRAFSDACGCAMSRQCKNGFFCRLGLGTRSVGSLPAPPTHTACPNGSGVTEAVKGRRILCGFGSVSRSAQLLYKESRHRSEGRAFDAKEHAPPSDAAVRRWSCVT